MIISRATFLRLSAVAILCAIAGAVAAFMGHKTTAIVLLGIAVLTASVSLIDAVVSLVKTVRETKR